jgi:hypothetical protein
MGQSFPMAIVSTDDNKSQRRTQHRTTSQVLARVSQSFRISVAGSCGSTSVAKHVHLRTQELGVQSKKAAITAISLVDTRPQCHIRHKARRSGPCLVLSCRHPLRLALSRYRSSAARALPHFAFTPPVPCREALLGHRSSQQARSHRRR